MNNVSIIVNLNLSEIMPDNDNSTEIRDNIDPERCTRELSDQNEAVTQVEKDERSNVIQRGRITPRRNNPYNGTADERGPYVLFPNNIGMTPYEATVYYWLDMCDHDISISGDYSVEHNIREEELLEYYGDINSIEEKRDALTCLQNALVSLRKKEVVQFEELPVKNDIQNGGLRQIMISLSTYKRYPECRPNGKPCFAFFLHDFSILVDNARNYGIRPYQAIAVWVAVSPQTIGCFGRGEKICERTGLDEETVKQCFQLFNDHKNELYYEFTYNGKYSPCFGSYLLKEKPPCQCA